MRSPLQIVPVGALLVACTTVRPVQPADLRAPNPPARVWVTHADHTTVVLDSARLSGDTLIGLVDGQPQRLPLSEATVLRARGPADARTEGLVLLGIGGVVVLWAHFAAIAPPIPTCASFCSLSQGRCVCDL
jgi:hypothetical protein